MAPDRPVVGKLLRRPLPHRILLEALSALSKVSKALSCCESVGLQGEEELLGQQEAGALGGVRGLVQLELRVLDASRRGCVGGRRRRRESLRALGGSGSRGGDGGGD